MRPMTHRHGTVRKLGAVKLSDPRKQSLDRSSQLLHSFVSSLELVSPFFLSQIFRAARPALLIFHLACFCMRVAVLKLEHALPAPYPSLVLSRVCDS
ncbi:hypothetical protein AAFF_G00337640 [Aldrovandia affinis]|uniref:Uncharacterized protein n=1 Tax=Aldrovandia affinis TaxID=143900 RepID=A0AAD7SM21_9TELE|nr:hypothetical protein AAFF_G00337640 [Aldrovandia affinis]